MPFTLLLVKAALVLLLVAIAGLSAAIDGDWMGPWHRGSGSDEVDGRTHKALP